MSTQSPAYPEDTSSTTGLRFAKILVWLVYAYFVIAVIILVMYFFLLLFNASTDAAFTQWVYRSGDRVLEPFRGIFPSPTADNGSVVDFAVFFGIIVYGIIAMVVHGLVDWLDRKIAEERAKTRYLATQNAAEQRTQQQAQAQQPAQQPAQQQQPPTA
jgi:uncharacterized protein YggT (Ycf19 family)